VNKKAILVALCAWIVVFSCKISASESKADKEYLEALSGDDDSAIKVLNKLSKQKKNPRIQYLSKAKLAQIYREKDDLEKARKCVAGFDDLSFLNKSKDTDLGTAYLTCYLELALLNALDNKATDSLRMLSYAENKTSGYDKTLTLIKYGEALTVLNKTKEAVEYLKKAEELCKKHIAEARKLAAGQAKAKNTDLAEWEKLSDSVFEAKYQLRIALLAEEYGKEYSRYVKLRILYDKGVKQKKDKIRKKYLTKAEKVCDEIIKLEPYSMYGQAAKFYKAKCAIGMADYKEAIKELKKFVKEDPNGLYRGEALTLLGKIELEQNWDAKASAKYYEQALTWFRNIRNVQNATELYAKLPKNVQESAKPKKKPVTYDKWHRMQYNSASDLAIVNRTTASWYLSSQEKEALFMLGFFQFLNQNYPEAKKLWSKIANIDADLAILGAKGIPNVIMRLKAACDQKYMLFSPKENKKLKAKQRLLLVMAEFDYLLEKFDESKKNYELCLKNPKADKNVKAAAAIGLGKWADMTQTPSKKEREAIAEKYFGKAIKLAENDSLKAKALFCMACYLQAGSETRELSIPCFNDYLKKYPNGSDIQAVRYRQARNYLEKGKSRHAEKLFRQIAKADPDSSYLRKLKRLEKFLNENSDKKGKNRN
jgi:tetratricopeptide (TPR) repeat protein